MIQVFLNTQIYLFLFSLILILSCSDQISETKNTQSQLISIKDSLKDEDTISKSPRVDSVLQFSVMVTAMFEDSKGNFWVGSHGDGLCRFDGKGFTYFTVNHGLPSGVDREFAPGPDWSKVRVINGGNQIASIQEDKNGVIWVKTYDNIIKFNGQTFVAVSLDAESTLTTDRSDDEWKKELNYLWFGSLNRLGVYRYDGQTLEFLTLPTPYVYKQDGISKIYKDNEGNVWLGTMGNGTFRYDGKSFSRINNENEIGVCRSVFQDDRGRVWITNNLHGLNYFENKCLDKFYKRI